MRDHSSLSRGHRRRGREPLCSRSRRVVISFVSFVSDVDTTCANADTSSTSSGVRPETARRTSIVYSSYTISSHRRRPRRRGRAHTRRVRCLLVHRRRASSTSYPPTSPPSRLARDRRVHRQSLRTLESRRRVDGYSPCPKMLPQTLRGSLFKSVKVNAC